MMRSSPADVPGRQRRRTNGQSPYVLRSAPTSGASCRSLDLGDGDALDVGERQLQEALAELAEELRLAGREEAIGAGAAALVLPALALERVRHLAGSLL